MSNLFIAIANETEYSIGDRITESTFWDTICPTHPVWKATVWRNLDRNLTILNPIVSNFKCELDFHTSNTTPSIIINNTTSEVESNSATGGNGNGNNGNGGNPHS